MNLRRCQQLEKKKYKSDGYMCVSLTSIIANSSIGCSKIMRRKIRRGARNAERTAAAADLICVDYSQQSNPSVGRKLLEISFVHPIRVFLDRRMFWK